jgi:uncharacterized protein
MKSSKYNILIDEPETGKLVVFNSLTGAIAVCDPPSVSAVKTVLNSPDQGAVSHPETYATLAAQRYIIPGHVDELEILKARKHAGIADPNRLDLIVLPTLNCNFACPYCYEERRPSEMNDETEKGVNLWMEHEIPKHKVLLMSWFGGEPLLGYAKVLSLSKAAVRIAQANGVSFIGHMTTNGYLLDAARIQELVSAEILDYQITLDGTADTHDHLRMLRGGGATFERVHHHIILLARADPRVRVTVRVNFNHTNLHTVPELLTMFPKEIRGQLAIELEPIFGDCSQSATVNLSPTKTSSDLARYCALAQSMGFNVQHGLGQIHTGKLVYCNGERESQYVIGPDGSVFKCAVCKFNREERVGVITPDGSFVKDDGRWAQYVNDDLFAERCCSCTYLPLCMGGCRSARLRMGNPGSYCSLIPTNANFLLKQLALGGIGTFMKEAVCGQACSR